MREKSETVEKVSDRGFEVLSRKLRAFCDGPADHGEMRHAFPLERASTSHPGASGALGTRHWVLVEILFWA
jgi:hypothetical protein